VSQLIAALMGCNCCLATGDVGLNLIMKSDVSVPEYASKALPDLIQSVPTGHGDSTAENKVV